MSDRPKVGVDLMRQSHHTSPIRRSRASTMSRWSRPAVGLGLGAVVLGALSGSCAVSPPRFGWQLPILADTTGRELPRPRLAPGADTNDARAYYACGDDLLHRGRSLDTADLAFYWAARLDPAWAEPLYARAAVIVRAFKWDVALRRWHGVVQLAPRQRHLVDSLTRLALGRDPFIGTRFDLIMGSGPGIRPHEDDPVRLGLNYYHWQQFRTAIEWLGKAIALHPGAVELRVYRAHAYYYLQRYDSTVADLQLALDTLRRRETGQLVPIYLSKEMFEYAVGMAEVQRQDYAAGRAAFARALVENLSFYMAHARLAGVAFGQHDTATALAELDLAVQLAPRDPTLRFYDGYALLGVKRYDEASAQLASAIDLDPEYAAPYFERARLEEARGRRAAAAPWYQAFLAHAAATAPDRTAARRRLATLDAAPPDSR